LKIDKEDFVTELQNPPETLCIIGDSTFTTAALAVYLNNSKSLKPGSSPLELDKKINDFLNESIIAVENANLEKKYPEFRYLLNEYHDGLLIFEISQNEIWNKASADSTVLRRYYEEHKEKYVTPDKFSGNIFFCKNRRRYSRRILNIKRRDFPVLIWKRQMSFFKVRDWRNRKFL